MKMTLFHVFFLVSLMWAVRSHGWAYETECKTYWHTQLPYKENMSAETLMPRQSLHFDYFYLVLTWPATFCSWDDSCRSPIPYNFTVHGLWPQRWYGPRICCERNTQLSLHRPLGNRLVKQLRPIWPSLQNAYTDFQFWKYEYDGHGSCFLETPEQYFGLTVGMMPRLLGLRRKLEIGGVISGPGRHDFRLLREMIRAATKFSPLLECDRSNQLYQIYFCASHAGSLFNCPSWFNVNVNGKCGSSVLFPKPRRSRRGP